MLTNTKEQVHVIIKEGNPHVFKEFEDAVSFVSEHNYKAGMQKLFIREGNEKFDEWMEEYAHTGEATDNWYAEWQESRLKELGLTMNDVLNGMDILFIKTVEVR